jgi:hypothetical protein
MNSGCSAPQKLVEIFGLLKSNFENEKHFQRIDGLKVKNRYGCPPI